MKKYAIFQRLVFRIKIILTFFFGLAFFVNVLRRSYYSSEAGFHLSTFEWLLLITTLLVFINPKGIKLFVISVFAFFTLISTRDVFLFSRSGMPRGLLLQDLFDFLNLDSFLVYLIHMIIYIMLCWLMFISSKARNNHLPDQE